MKHLYLLIPFTFAIAGTVQAQTQAEMNKRASEEYQKADTELNRIYQQIITEYADDPTFLEALRTSQRNWIVFRDSELKMKYPAREPGWYGSIHPMCVSFYMAELTMQRTANLKAWLTTMDEGDACEGSVNPNR